jgi:uroporphyrinogen-III synthase
MERRKSKRLGEQSTAEPVLRTIAVTRPVGKGGDTAEFVRSLGWTPFIFHTVDLKPVERREITNRLQYCLSQGPIAWIVFMSSSGVRLLFDIIGSDSRLQKALETTRFLAVGPKTRDSLVHYGISQVFLPERYSSTGIDEFFSRTVSKNLHVVLIRSASADDSLANSLTSRGIVVRTINAYDSVMPKDLQSAHNFLDELLRGRFAAVLFTSAVSVSNLFEIAKTKLDESQVVELLNGVHVGAIGPAAAKELESRGIGFVMPDEYLIENALLKLTAQETMRRVQTVAS